MTAVKSWLVLYKTHFTASKQKVMDAGRGQDHESAKGIEEADETGLGAGNGITGIVVVNGMITILGKGQEVPEKENIGKDVKGILGYLTFLFPYFLIFLVFFKWQSKLIVTFFIWFTVAVVDTMTNGTGTVKGTLGNVIVKGLAPREIEAEKGNVKGSPQSGLKYTGRHVTN